MNEKSLDPRTIIVATTRRLLAEHGAVGLGMRQVAMSCSMSVSSLYHYFHDKDSLLKAVFDETNTQLGRLRADLPAQPTAAAKLQQLVEFQLDHAEEVVAVLKYYLAYRNLYQKNDRGVLPEKAYLHMLEVVESGVASGEFEVRDSVSDAQVMTHAVNGYLLEYYPYILPQTEKNQLATKITNFLLRALRGGEYHD